MYHCGNFWCRVGLGTIVLNGIEAALLGLEGQATGPAGACAARRLEILTARPATPRADLTNYPKERLAKKDGLLSGPRIPRPESGRGMPLGEGKFLGKTPTEAADFEADKFAFMRNHVGPDVNLMMDAHMGNNHTFTWTVEIAIAVAKALEPYNLFFLEEALHYTDPWGYAELCKRHDARRSRVASA